MERVPCAPNPGCKYWDSELGCHEDTHHVYFPRRIIRRLGSKVEASVTVELCREFHDELHATTKQNLPEKKP